MQCRSRLSAARTNRSRDQVWPVTARVNRMGPLLVPSASSWPLMTSVAALLRSRVVPGAMFTTTPVWMVTVPKIRFVPDQVTELVTAPVMRLVWARAAQGAMRPARARQRRGRMGQGDGIMTGSLG